MRKISEIESRTVIGGEIKKYYSETCHYCGDTYSDWYFDLGLFTMFYDSAVTNVCKALTKHIEYNHKDMCKTGR